MRKITKKSLMNTKLILIFVKRISFAKIFNSFKVGISYLFSVITKKSIRWGLPLSISVEPTTSCNLSCPECPVGNNTLYRNKGQIDPELFKQIVDTTSRYLLNLFLYFQGEPFLNNNIFEMISYASKNNIYTTTSTNGHFLTKENSFRIIDANLDKLIISLDGTTQEVYSQYRINGDLMQVIAGIKNLVEIREQKKSKKPFIELQFLVLKTNEHQIEEIKKIAEDLKIDKLSLKSAQIYNYKNDVLFIPKKKKYSRYKNINGKWQLKNTLKNRCWRLWNSVVVTWEGNVLPCCFDKDAKYSFGNIKNEKFVEIIKNRKFKSFANRVLTNRKDVDICRNCSE